MSLESPTYVIFGPLPQGAPGNDSSTLRALELIPDRDEIRQVIDLGAGHGRTTFALAQALPDALITAIEIHAPFVEQMSERAKEAGLEERVQAMRGDMAKINIADGSIDLIWAEGSIYVVGMEQALTNWRPWLRSGGYIAFSDFVQWTGEMTEAARAFWAAEYPDMSTEATIRARAKVAGYRVVADFRMPKDAHDAYYVPLEARVSELSGCGDDEIQQVLAGIRKETEVVRRYADEAGYTIFVLQIDDGYTPAERRNQQIGQLTNKVSKSG